MVLKRVRALGCYRLPYVNLVHALKYSGKTALARVLGESLAALVLQDTELARADVVCAVPLHPARLRERGFNQSELLARVVAEQTGKPLAAPIVRRRNTPTQTARHDDAARRRNLAGAFAPRPGAALQGGRVILVDDVMTSGATLDAAAQELLRAGAGDVVGLVIAAVGKPGAPKPGAGRRGCLALLGMRARRRVSPVRPGAG
ncbi:ComF family protein [candidate division WOR-3 bacterium]|nr:ComF family protein [candidate division WOR-3 bacterium]